MQFDLDQRTAALAVGEFSEFALGPREEGPGGGGLWRAQLGTHWHNELRTRATTEHAAAAAFEVPVKAQIAHRGWVITLNGRIDQLVRSPAGITLREIKTVTRELPADEGELRRDYPEYFVQAAGYLHLAWLGALVLEPASGLRPNDPTGRETDVPLAAASTVSRPLFRAELVFVEVTSGLSQSIAITAAEDGLFRAQLERLTEFLDLRLRARERLRRLHFRPAFVAPRPGQETTRAELTSVFERHPLVFFEAPTGFGKTGVLLEFALGQLRSAHFDRVLYLTSKSTGQLQVVRTLQAMTAPSTPSTQAAAESASIALWHVRNKSEHCINHSFHCIRDHCTYLADAAARWPGSGLSRFYLFENQPRDIDVLRHAGREARICPYEITRTALAFNDVWIGDYNYVFAPRNRGLFFHQPGFDPARTLLLIDEAHNLPSRVADAYSQVLTATDAYAVRDELQRTRPNPALMRAWDHWCHFLQHLRSTDALTPTDEDDVRHLLSELAKLIPSTPLDLAALGPQTATALWQVPALVEDLTTTDLPRLWWCPHDGELTLTCLDAAPAIGRTLREFGGVVLASATLTPIDDFAVACGLDTPDLPPAPAAAAPERLGTLNKRQTRKLYTQLTSAASLLKVEEARAAAAPALLQAHAPWRDGAYDVAVDTRVDTTFQHRHQHFTTTAATIADFHRFARAARDGQPPLLFSATSCVAVFFPSFAYAQSIAREIALTAPDVHVVLQPKLRDLAAQTAWVDEALLVADALFLVLGSSFAEGIDALGGRVTHAMVVGPALPEVNAVQRARLAQFGSAGRDAAFRRVYQAPGITKVNQALGRLVRAPGQRARVLLHCRRFLEPSYASLLAPEYRHGVPLMDDLGLGNWFEKEKAPASTPF